MLKIALFLHFYAGSDIRTNFIQFLNFWEIWTSSKKSFETSTTGPFHLDTGANLQLKAYFRASNSES